MNLLSLPLDVLLVIFRDLSIVDIVCLGTTCKDLHRTTHDRHVWVDQLEKSCQKKPALRTATPTLTSLSTQELKTFVTGVVKLRLRWDKEGDELGFAAKAVIGVPGISELKLLPGGKSLLFIDGRGGVEMCRIKLEVGQVSLPRAANIKYDQKTVFGTGWSRLLTAMSPCPILIHTLGTDIHVLRIDHHNDAMSLETTVPIPEGYGFRTAHGQGRTVGFLIHGFNGPPRALIIRLDYPGVIMELVVPSPLGPNSHLWGFCIPIESLMVVFNTQHALTYEIPDSSGLPSGFHLSNATPTQHRLNPGWVGESIHVSYMTSEALYDPSSAQEVNLHYFCRQLLAPAEPLVATITMPISTDGDPASESTEPPLLKIKETLIRRHGRDSAGTSCRKGLHSDKALLNDGLDILVTPLDDLVLKDGKGTLRMSVPYQEFGFKWSPQTVEIDMDEATGRVVVWGWDRDACETKIFVADLV